MTVDLQKLNLYRLCVKVARCFPLSESLQVGIASTSPPELKIELDVNHGVIQVRL